MSNPDDDEMARAFEEMARPRRDYDDVDADPPLRPLCTHCVRDLPVGDGDLCQFCIVLAESEL
jgi:hypothetical protein